MRDRTVQIVYASASGNTLFVSQHLFDSIKDLVDVEINRVESIQPDKILNDNDLFIFAVSTWEHGEINPHFEPFLKVLSEKDMNDKKAAFIGLGDLRYEPILFCKGMDILRDAFITQGGKELLSPLKIDGDPFDHLDTIVENWIFKLRGKLNSA